mgnify:CR=1 FL=1
MTRKKRRKRNKKKNNKKKQRKGTRQNKRQEKPSTPRGYITFPKHYPINSSQVSNDKYPSNPKPNKH